MSCASDHVPPARLARNASSGSAFSDYNSMERPAASERRKKETAAGSSSGSRFDATRVDPEDVINDLLQNTDLNTDHAEGGTALAGVDCRRGSNWGYREDEEGLMMMMIWALPPPNTYAFFMRSVTMRPCIYLDVS